MAQRKYYNKKDYLVDLENRVLILGPELYEKLHSNNKWTKYKKIGGSSIGDILLKNEPFKSEFSAFCHITRLKLPVLAEKYVRAGTVLEPIIFDKLRENQPNKNVAKIINYVAADYNYDYFDGLDPIFGGVPDGYMCSLKELELKKQLDENHLATQQAINLGDLSLANYLKEQKVLLEQKYAELHKEGVILEIKTAGQKKMEKWDAGEVDLSYRKQSQLYAYLNGNFRYVIVALFLEEEDYIDPEKVNLDQRNMRSYKFTINENEVKDDITTVRNWYTKYTNTNISPQFDLNKDQDQVDYLLCENETQWAELLDKWKKIGKADADKTI
ncbi:MAGa7180 family putative nuclease [Mycoplasma hafezii]|uniref:MAGa7180 family putative nuclease n=1 Tax=Mycoplasma hafezii TaxID=525886 RepID=UPI003CF23406